MRSYAEVALEDLGPRLDLARRAFVRDMAVVEDVDALRKRQGRRQVLLHQLAKLAAMHRRELRRVGPILKRFFAELSRS